MPSGESRLSTSPLCKQSHTSDYQHHCCRSKEIILFQTEMSLRGTNMIGDVQRQALLQVEETPRLSKGQRDKKTKKKNTQLNGQNIMFLQLKVSLKNSDWHTGHSTTVVMVTGAVNSQYAWNLRSGKLIAPVWSLELVYYTRPHTCFLRVKLYMLPS